MAQNVSEQLVEILAMAGCKHVFGMTGDALNYFVQGINGNPEVKWINMRHEENAAFAAYAQGEIDGLGVCAGTLGPGALHLINGLYNAKKERTPVVAVTGQVALDQQGTNFFQESNLRRTFDDLCAYQAVINSAEAAPRLFQRAIQTAISQRTVTRIELPDDIGRLPAAGKKYIHQFFEISQQLMPSDKSVNAAADLIKSAEKITILAGAGCRKARDEVIALSRLLKAPIVHTLRSADIFDHEIDNVTGLTGLIGNPAGYKAVLDCDLLIMIGTDFPYDNYLANDVKVLQIDIRAENLGNRVGLSVAIHGDAKTTLERLLTKIKPGKDPGFLAKHRNSFHQWREEMKQKFSVSNDFEPLHPQIFTQVINEKAADDAIFTVETSTAAIWTVRHISFYKNRRILGSFNHGSMGVGLPAAIGAQITKPGLEVWALCGDGGFGMAMQDFITAVRYQLPVKFVIFNNSSLQLINLEMENAGDSPNQEAASLTNPDFAEFARLCGGDGIQVKHAADIEPAIEQAKQSKKPFIIDAIVSGTEIPFPPHISLQDALNLTESKLKEAKDAIKGNKKQWEFMMEQLKTLIN